MKLSIASSILTMAILPSAVVFGFTPSSLRRTTTTTAAGAGASSYFNHPLSSSSTVIFATKEETPLFGKYRVTNYH